VAVILAVTRAEMAGMDGNRTHPGRLNSAPQTVLKTAGQASTSVHRSPLRFDPAPSDSRIVRLCTPVSVKLAVFLAVSDRIGGGTLYDEIASLAASATGAIRRDTSDPCTGSQAAAAHLESNRLAAASPI
jgi:hypothetical protein